MRGDLAGLTVLLGRPPGEGGELLIDLRGLGAEVIVDPLIRRVPRLLPTGRLETLLRIGSKGKGLIFTSTHAVERFEAELRRARLDVAAWREWMTLVVGPVTADAAKRIGLRGVCHHPELHRAEGILALVTEMGGEGWNFVWPRAELVRDCLLDGIPALGAVLTSLVVYATETAGPPSDEVLERLSGRERVIVPLASPSAARALVERLGAHRARFECICIGEITELAARELGLHVIERAESASSGGLLEAIRRGAAAATPSRGDGAVTARPPREEAVVAPCPRDGEGRS